MQEETNNTLVPKVDALIESVAGISVEVKGINARLDQQNGKVFRNMDNIYKIDTRLQGFEDRIASLEGTRTDNKQDSSKVRYIIWGAVIGTLMSILGAALANGFGL